MAVKFAKLRGFAAHGRGPPSLKLFSQPRCLSRLFVTKPSYKHLSFQLEVIRWLGNRNVVSGRHQMYVP